MSGSAISDEDFDKAFDAPDEITGSIDETAPAVKDADSLASSSESVAVEPDDALKSDAHAAKALDKADKDREEPAEAVEDLRSDIGQENDLLNWDSAPKSFREKYDETKRRLLEVEKNSLTEKYFAGSDDFLDELNTLSTEQFNQTTQAIVKRGIEAMPDEFAAYLASVKPDAVLKALSTLSPDILAQSLFGSGVTASQAQKIIRQVKEQDLMGVLDDGDDAADAKGKAPTTKDNAAPEPLSEEAIEKRIKQGIEQATMPQRIEALEQRTYAEIMAPVERQIEEAGLKPAVGDTPEEVKFKEWASNRIIRDTFEFLMDSEANKPRAEKLLGFIRSLDENGVKHLTGTARIIAEDHAGSLIEMLTTKRAELKGDATKPTAKQPPKIVKSSASVPHFGNPQSNSGKAISDLSDSDFAAAGM